MKAPFSYFGGKSRAVDLVWHAFGAECLNYVEPFFGSGAMKECIVSFRGLYVFPAGKQEGKTTVPEDGPERAEQAADAARVIRRRLSSAFPRARYLVSRTPLLNAIECALPAVILDRAIARLIGTAGFKTDLPD